MKKIRLFQFSIILVLVLVPTVFRWYLFKIDIEYNFLFALISLLVFSGTSFFFEGLVKVFDSYLPYNKGIVKRLILQTFLTFGFIFIATRLAFGLGRWIIQSRMTDFQEIMRVQFTLLTEAVGYASEVLLAIILNIGHFSYFSLLQWRENAVRASLLEKEKSQVQFDNLKNQLNPHFLFNSLTSLDALIHENPDLASQFLRQLAKVFRYVLQNKEKVLVKLSIEIEFIENYVALLKTRFEEALLIRFDISEDVLDAKIVPVTLQILIENALKHNIVNASKPLIINIFDEDGYLVIENIIQHKGSVETSNGQGLNNLKTLYSFLGETEMIVEKNEKFQVKIPLIV